MLEVQRLEESGLPLKLEPVSLGSIARDAVSTLEGAAKPRGIAVELKAEGDPVLSLDRTLVRARDREPRRERDQVFLRRKRRCPFAYGPRRVGSSSRWPTAAGTKSRTRSRSSSSRKLLPSVEARQSGDRRRGFGLGLHRREASCDRSPTRRSSTVRAPTHEGGGFDLRVSRSRRSP